MANPDRNNPLKIHAAASAAVATGRFREAEGMYRQAIGIAESQMGASHPHVAKMAISLVNLYEDPGRYDEARQLSERVIGQIDPAQVAIANDQMLNRLRELCRCAGQLDKAITLYREAMTYRRKVFGDAHCKVAACIAGLAETYRDLGNVGKARSLLLRAASMAEEAGGDSSSMLAPRLRELRQSVLVPA